MWIRVEDRSPDKDGDYKVIRRAGRCTQFGGKKGYYEDVCKFENGYWHSNKGVCISTVEWWWCD